MDDHGTLLLRNPVRPVAWIIILGLPALGVAIAAAIDGNWTVAAVLIALMAAVGALAIWVAIRLLSPGILSEATLVGDTLRVRDVSPLNRGKLRTIPLAETSNWSRFTRRWLYGTMEGIAFDYAGQRVFITTTSAQVADTAALDALLARQSGASEKAPPLDTGPRTP